MSYKTLDHLNDRCPQCQEISSRVFSEPKDSQGHNDLYVCDDCQLTWPTEWSDAYKFKVKKCLHS